MGRIRNVRSGEIVRLYQEGLSIRQIARRLGLAFGTVQNRLKKKGVVFRPTGDPNSLSDHTRVEILEMYTRLEMTTREIACELGVSQFTVWNNLRDAGVLRSAEESRRLARLQGKSKYAPPAPDGTRNVAFDGYVWVKMRNHPHANRSGWVREHILVWEAIHGLLPDRWVIHHDNEVKNDNRIENLYAMPREDHMRLHQERRRLSAPESSEVLV